MINEQKLLRIDLGCGSIKKEGTLGLDILAVPGVDYVLDIEKQPLPFEDRSVEYVYSSHFLEHTANFGDVFVQISRVCADGAQLECGHRMDGRIRPLSLITNSSLPKRCIIIFVYGMLISGSTP